MRYSIRDVPHLLRSPVGRRQLRASLRSFLSPLFLFLSRIYRHTLIRGVCIVAVVGSFGKSTTTSVLRTALGLPPSERAHFNARAGIATALFRIRPWHKYAVLEVGIDHPGEMAHNAKQVRPNITVVTSVGSEHGSSIGTLEATRDEKANMIRVLRPSGLAVLNGDDPNVLWMRTQTFTPCITCGRQRDNVFRATNLSLADWPNGMTYTLDAPGLTRQIRTRLIGWPTVYPILAAVAVLQHLKLPLEPFLKAIEEFSPIPGRLQPVPLPSGAVILRDEFKSALETVEAALDVLEAIPAKRRIVVIGQVTEPPGLQGTIYRHLGERIGRIAQRAIFICDRRDSACSAGAAAAGIPQSAMSKLGRDFYKAVDILKHDLGPGDVVLIKGRITERLERIALALEGRAVQCRIGFCKTRVNRCDTCPMLDRGWRQSKPVI